MRLSHTVHPPRMATAVGAAVGVWGLAIGLLRLHDNSFLTHVATGRLILAHGLPTHDPYSFTAHGDPWVVESWFASLCYGVVEKVAGGHGLQVLHAALAAVLAGLVWLLTRPAQTLVGRILAAAVVLAVGTGYWTPRPLLIALRWGALALAVAGDGRLRRAPVPARRGCLLAYTLWRTWCPIGFDRAGRK